MKLFSYVFLFALVAMLLLTGCSKDSFQKPSVKDDFCGAHINYQYCKCAFHNKYCDVVGMSKSQARTFVMSEYDDWVDTRFKDWEINCQLKKGIVDGNVCIHCDDLEGEAKEKCQEALDAEKYGVIVKNGIIHIKSKPGEVLSLTANDLPASARNALVVVGASIVNVGPPDTVVSGDPNVLFNGKPVARLHDETAHGGSIVEGSSTIFINGIPAAFVGGNTVCPMITGTVPHVGGPISTTG